MSIRRWRRAPIQRHRPARAADRSRIDGHERLGAGPSAAKGLDERHTGVQPLGRKLGAAIRAEAGENFIQSLDKRGW